MNPGIFHKKGRKDGIDETGTPAGNGGTPMNEVPEIVILKGRKNARQIIHAAVRLVSVLLVAAAVLLLIQVELPDYVFAAEPGEEIRAKDMIRDGSPAKIGIVYPADEEKWARDESVRLSEKIDSAYDIDTEVLSDGEYLPDNDFTLTLSVGHTDFITEQYITGYLRLGGKGYEISHLENEENETWLVSILAFSADSCRNACDRFISFFLSKNRLFNSSGSLYVSVTDENTRNGYVILDAPDGFTYLTVSRPGADKDSLHALDALIAEASPDLVIFNGNLTGDCSDRSGLADMWSPIISVISARSVKFTAVAGENDGEDPSLLSMLYEIMGVSGLYLPVPGGTGNAAPLFIADEKGLPYACILLSDSASVRNDGFAEAAETAAPVLRSCPDIICTAVMPVLTADASALALSDTSDGIKIYGTLPACAAGGGNMSALFSVLTPRAFVLWAGNNAVGTLASADGTLYGLCGSADFLSEGIGGRYELNNSLRGGFVTRIVPADGITRFQYVYAADIGAVGR